MLLAQYKHPKKVAREAFMSMMWLACHISLVAPGYVRAGLEGNQSLGDIWETGKNLYCILFAHVNSDFLKVLEQLQ